MLEYTKIVMMFFLLSAHAMGRGSGASNNAGGLACPDQTYLFDLWEAAIPTVYSSEGLDVVESDDSLDDQVYDKLELMQEIGGNRYAAYISKYIQNYNYVRHIARPLPKERSLILSAPLDLGQHITKKGCDLRGLISWNDSTNRVWYDDELYSQLSTTHKAAMWVHEAIYRTLRETKWVSDSTETRRIVSYLFSGFKNIEAKMIFPSNLDWYEDGKPQLFESISSEYFFNLLSTSCTLDSISFNGAPLNPSSLVLSGLGPRTISFNFSGDTCVVEYAIMAANHDEYFRDKVTLTQSDKILEIEAVHPK